MLFKIDTQQKLSCVRHFSFLISLINSLVIFFKKFSSDNTCLSTREVICKTIFTMVSVPSVSRGLQKKLDKILMFLIKQTKAGFAAIQLLSSTPGLSTYFTIRFNFLTKLPNFVRLFIKKQVLFSLNSEYLSLWAL